MAMIKQLRKVGNGNALLLDKSVLELMGLGENGQVQLTVHDGSLIVTPVSPRTVDPAKFQKCLNRVVGKRRSALRKLAQ
jgi:antitoxin component of MazEF toxin-antitoxin module